MELKKIIKSTSYLIFSKVIQFLIGIVRSKLAAIFIGTTGVGIFSQVNYLVTMISNITLLSMNDGLVKQIAQEKDKPRFNEILKSLVKSYSLLILLSSLIAIIICVFFAEKLTIFFLGDIKYMVYYLIGISCLPITISNSLSFAILKSHKATKYISRSNIFSSSITVIAFIPLVIYLKTTGAVISIVINYFILLIINNYQARKNILKSIGLKFIQLFVTKFKSSYIKGLLKFAFYGATSGLVLILSESICRSILINRLGIDKMGIYSPVTSWSGLFTGFIIPTINIYLFPRYSECKSNTEIIGIYNDFNKLISYIMVPLLFLAIPLRHIIIPIFYSDSFIEAAIYLPWHFMGLLFYMWWYPMALILTPTGRIKTYSIFIVLMAILDIVVVYTSVPILGLYGWMLKHIVSRVVFFLVFYIYLNRIIKFHITINNLILMGYLIIVSLALTTIFDNLAIKYIISILGIAASILFLSKNELNYIKSKIGLDKKE